MTKLDPAPMVQQLLTQFPSVSTELECRRLVSLLYFSLANLWMENHPHFSHSNGFAHADFLRSVMGYLRSTPRNATPSDLTILHRWRTCADHFIGNPVVNPQIRGLSVAGPGTQAVSFGNREYQLCVAAFQALLPDVRGVP